MTTEEKIQIAEDLVKKGFTDGVDISPEISLYEYGILRRPSDGLTIFGFPSDDNHLGDYDKFDYIHISIEDVKEELEDIEDGFYSFIGVKKEEKINYTHILNNDCLSYEISSLNAYCGSFSESCYYNKSIEDIKNTFLKKEV